MGNDPLENREIDLDESADGPSTEPASQHRKRHRQWSDGPADRWGDADDDGSSDDVEKDMPGTGRGANRTVTFDERGSSKNSEVEALISEYAPKIAALDGVDKSTDEIADMLKSTITGVEKSAPLPSWIPTRSVGL